MVDSSSVVCSLSSTQRKEFTSVNLVLIVFSCTTQIISFYSGTPARAKPTAPTWASGVREHGNPLVILRGCGGQPGGRPGSRVGGIPPIAAGLGRA
jgi:hypothetical protein